MKGQVQTECNALRDLFARTTAAMSGSGSQHDRRLNTGKLEDTCHSNSVEAVLTMVTLRFRMEGYAAVLSRDGQGGALLREVAKLEKFDGTAIETLVRTFWDVQQLCAAMAAASNYVHPWRGSNACKEKSQRESGRWTSSLVRSHAMVLQTQISGGASGIDGKTHIAQAHQERE